MPIMQQDLQSRSTNLCNWLSQLTRKDGAGLSINSSPSLLPTAFATIARELAGSSIDEQEQEQISNLIRSQQDPETGFFDAGQLLRKELSSHSATYIQMQATYFAVHALDALNTRPEHRIQYVRQLQNIDYLRGWLDGGPWQNPWLHSNHVMFALTFLQTDHLWYEDEASIVAFDAILDYLDQRQDPESGLWQPDDGVDMQNAVYAAYHFFPYYFWRARRPQFIDRIIDSTLSIQDADGLYGGGACEDLDAVHTLVLMTLVSDYRAGDIKQSLNQCYWRLLQLQNEDGGFCNHAKTPIAWVSWKRRILEQLGLTALLPTRLRDKGKSSIPTWKYSGWKQLECPYGSSDVWGGWFRPLAIKLIADCYPESVGIFPAGKYRSLPGLGWHDVDRIRESSLPNEIHTRQLSEKVTTA